jgi:hypothetical protein
MAGQHQHAQGPGGSRGSECVMAPATSMRGSLLTAIVPCALQAIFWGTIRRRPCLRPTARSYCPRLCGKPRRPL